MNGSGNLIACHGPDGHEALLDPASGHVWPFRLLESSELALPLLAVLSWLSVLAVSKLS